MIHKTSHVLCQYHHKIDHIFQRRGVFARKEFKKCYNDFENIFNSKIKLVTIKVVCYLSTIVLEHITVGLKSS